MSQSRLVFLMQGYFEGKATNAETDELMALLASAEHDDKILREMEHIWKEFHPSDVVFSPEKSRAILNSILKVQHIPQQRATKKRWWVYAAAALVIISIGLAIIFQLTPGEVVKTDEGLVKQIVDSTAIVPGGNKAILTLADHSTIVLDSVQNGTLSQQGKTSIVKLSDGQLVYAGSHNADELMYNTVSTPRGGQYQMTLSDGTKVWLNAASSIKFPVSFSGKERSVEITGEAYFEVAKNTAKPFKVVVMGMQEVEVLGTHFNINSYSDEASVNTTLLEGRVRVTASHDEHGSILLPGQQAQLNRKGQLNIFKNAEIAEVMAWKNGYFLFNSAGIETILRQAARWYDVAFVYTGNLNETFSGTLPRASNIMELLKILEATDKLKFKINGRTITVMEK